MNNLITMYAKRGLLFGLVFACLGASVPALAKPSPDPHVFRQWYLDHIDAPPAWDTTTGSRDIVVAVLDTGVDVDHPDLADNVWLNGDEIGGDGIDNDGNGFVDDVHGWDFIDDDSTPAPNITESFADDAVAHGTAIAGVIGAVGDNETGIAGISWRVKIMSLRILDNFGSGNSLDANAAVAYAVANGADVISLSFSGFDLDERFRDTLQSAYEAGVVVVAAMGNDSKNGGVDSDEQPIYPACFVSPEGEDLVIGVAATDEEDKKASFSNYGGCTDISAPGVRIFSTLFQDTDHPSFQSEYGGFFAGTSLAVPMVSGTVALLKAQYPTLTPKQIKTILQLSVEAIAERGSLAVGKLGAGRLNVAQALTIAAGFVQEESEPVQESVAPTVEPIQPVTNPNPSVIVVAPEGGRAPVVRVLSPQGEQLQSFLAFDEGFTGGVRLAIDDIDGDGSDEIVAVPGPGHVPVVKLFEQDGTLIREFGIPNQPLRSGWFVTTGDMNRDGSPDVIVSSDKTGSAEVQLLTTQGVSIGSFLLPPHRQSQSARVAAGDVDGDAVDEIVVSFGAGSPELLVFEADGVLANQFLAYDAVYDRGVFVSVGDLNHDGIAEIVTGTDTGGGPQVQIYGGSGRWLGTFFAYDKLFRGGVRLGIVGDTIVTAAGPGGGPHVRVFNNRAKVVGGFFSDDEQDRNGITIGSY